MKCELCESDGGELVWRDDQCRVVRVDEPGYRGFYRAIWNAHVKEMTDLSAGERARLLQVVFALESALRERLCPEKINLASLGNVTPHLHWHVIARFRDDPHFPNPVWGPLIRQPDARAHARIDIAAALAGALSRLRTERRGKRGNVI